jgi:hypothetical protein
VATLLSVANANCNGGIAESSQRNDAVAIAAPGTGVLSTVPDAYKYVRAAVQLDVDTSKALAAASGARNGKAPSYPEARPMQDAPINGTGTMRLLADCGDAPKRSSAAGQRGTVGGQLRAPLFNACTAAKGGGVCMIGLPGHLDIYEESCLAMLSCMDGGGSALIAWRSTDVDELRERVAARNRSAAAQSRGRLADRGGPASLRGSGAPLVQADPTLSMDAWAPNPSLGGGGGGSGDGAYDDNFDREILPGARLNCGTKCDCWNQMQQRMQSGAKVLPGVFIGSRQALDMLNAVRGSSAAGQLRPKANTLRANVTIFDYPYRRYDGTSMAVPHVAGAAARIWAAFPSCSALDVSRALRESADASKLKKVGSISRGSGFLQVEEAYKKLKSFNCK